MSETSTNLRPLNGDFVPGLKITGNDPRNLNGRTLARRWHGIEFGRKEIAETFIHPALPGVGVVFLHEAFDGDTIESARLRNPHSQRFLLSKIGETGITATSSMGYDRSGLVRVYPDEFSVIPDDQINLVDLSVQDDFYTNGSTLVEQHVERVVKGNGDPSQPLEIEALDESFRRLISGTVEIC